MFDGQGEDVDHGLMQALHPVLPKPGRISPGMNASQKQGFVGVDISHAAQEALIEKQRLDLSFSCAEQFDELGQLNPESIGAQFTSARREIRTPFDPPEMPYVVVNQEPAVEFENCAGVGARMPVQEQLAGHAEVDGKGAVAELDHNELAVAADGFDHLSAHMSGEFIKILPHDKLGKKLGLYNAPSRQARG